MKERAEKREKSFKRQIEENEEKLTAIDKTTNKKEWQRRNKILGRRRRELKEFKEDPEAFFENERRRREIRRDNRWKAIDEAITPPTYVDQTYSQSEVISEDSSQYSSNKIVSEDSSQYSSNKIVSEDSSQYSSSKMEFSTQSPLFNNLEDEEVAKALFPELVSL